MAKDVVVTHQTGKRSKSALRSRRVSTDYALSTKVNKLIGPSPKSGWHVSQAYMQSKYWVKGRMVY